MNQPLEKPIKRLCKDLLADSELLDGIVAVSFTPNGDLKCHGAGIVSTQPELALIAAARLICTLIGDFGLSGHSHIDIMHSADGRIQITTGGQTDTDPRAVVALLSCGLIELAKVIAGLENVMPEPEVDDGA